MSFDAVIRVLRDGADDHARNAVEIRRRAGVLPAYVSLLSETAKQHDDLAECFGLLADALATGQLTKDQLRAIVTVANLDAQGIPAAEQPRDVFGRCAAHLLPLDENGVCQFNEDDQHPEKDDDGLLPDPLVMDADEYHASIWTDAVATASTAQLEGYACINCARFFGGEPNYSAAIGPRGQLFAHTNPADCTTDTQERAL